MSHRMGDVAIICEEPDRECQMCGAQAETRPYGPGGIRICHPCGKKDPERTEAWMAHVLFGDALPEKYK